MSYRRLVAWLSGSLALLTARVVGQEWPDPQWKEAAAAKVGLDEAKLAAARTYAESGDGSGCIIRHGKRIIAWGDVRQQFDLKSTTKSFGSIALGLAISDGKVRLEDKARAHHPALGVTMHLVFSGDDCFSVRRATIQASH